MKNKAMGVVQLVLSIVVILLFSGFYWKVLSLFGLHFSGLAYTIANFIKHLLVTLIVFVIYYRNIKAGKNRFNKTWLNSFIYCVSCFVFLVIITIVLHEVLNYLGNPRGIKVPYRFTNYFNTTFTLESALNLIVDAIFMPFLLCIVFPLGFSNIFQKSTTASVLAGITYGIIYAIDLHVSIEHALFIAFTPAVLVILLTYLYKTEHNIWSVVITYICYVLFGVFAINYIL
ncbi:MAG: hypothetical protein J1F35_04845 [Erysipelotrichales bacterium]|nr:hypothetical protein [Erysipelotrichales bacterium]